MEEIIKKLNEKVDGFNNLYETSEKLQNQLKGLVKVIVIKFEEEAKAIHLIFENGLSGVISGEPEMEADVTISSSPNIFHGILTGEQKAIKAFVKKTLRIKAKKLPDLLLLKRLLSTKKEDLQ